MSGFLGKTLFELHQTVTLREYHIYMAYRELELNRPSRTDYYIMQAAMEATRNRMKSPRQVSLKDYRIEFRSAEEKTREQKALESLSPEQQLGIAKGSWMAHVGMKPEIRKHLPGPSEP